MICLNVSVAQIGITWKVSSIKDYLNYLRWCGETHTEFGRHLLVAAQEKMGIVEGRLFTSFFLLVVYSQAKLFYLVAAANSEDDGGGDDNVGAAADPIADIRTNISRYWSQTE